MPRRQHAILGFRPAGFSPTLQDYHAYEVLRDDFLCSARGRAALLAGGIVARLARDAVNEQDVYDGPTENALQEGEHVLCVWEEGKHFALWDDNLTEEEIDLICGTYEVATGMDGIHQTAARSWWPRPGAWRSCGLNCGYWSRDAESWFQNRLNVIRAPGQSLALMTIPEWHSRLKFHKAHTLSKKNEGLALEYLKQKCGLSI
ncbi:hypothetical protein DFJ43DRAFT_1004458 [Lentinula guzmanii]|uniref:Uncharacterized protein n=1 Tax=Lentinula guzmanii TaxID=2804957 RepID=A0AA38J4M0_9AGAR|nr:hypothetical protein DFJ43DRAFT_1004458 [Lentinula guzmanii]